MALKAVLIAPDGQRLERYRQLIVSAEKGVEVVAMADSLAKGKEEIYRSMVGSLGTGGCLEPATLFLNILETRGESRHNH